MLVVAVQKHRAAFFEDISQKRKFRVAIIFERAVRFNMFRRKICDRADIPIYEMVAVRDNALRRDLDQGVPASRRNCMLQKFLDIATARHGIADCIFFAFLSDLYAIRTKKRRPLARLSRMAFRSSSVVVFPFVPVTPMTNIFSLG